MKRFIWFICLACASTTSLPALLPPFYESKRELIALLEHPDLAEKLASGQALESIKRRESGYEIETPKYRLFVEVVYQPTGKMGPADFHLIFHDKELRNDSK
jgi:hypothetical protein